MKRFLKRLLSVCIAVLMLVGMIPMVILPTQAAELTCAGFIDNADHRAYIDMMMKYYISSNQTLQDTLKNGQSVVFMFEGGSDNFPFNGYLEDYTNHRNQAVCIVVKQEGGVNKIVFHNENSSSLPSQPSYAGNNDKQTTILDGIYRMYTWNHQGDYGALQLAVNKGYYTPTSNPNGVLASASGINIHTRTTLQAGRPASAWSWGCQLIDYGNTSSNEFNQFMKTVAGLTFNVWTSYTGGNLTTISTGRTVGYYVLDRQLALDGMKSIYNSTAIANITAASKAAKEAAEAEASTPHVVETYPSRGHVTLGASGTKILDMPCTQSADANARVLETTSATEYEAIGLCKNDRGELWYTVKLQNASGEGYLYAGDTTDFEAINDIVISGVSVPETINQGNVSSLYGTVTAKYTRLTSVGAVVYQLGSTTKVTGHIVNGINENHVSLLETKFSISGRNIPLDYTVEYNKLAIGNYTLNISAISLSYYAANGTQTASTTYSMTFQKHFSVVNGSCSHTYTTQVTAPSCESEGYAKHTCSACNSSYLNAIQAPLGHTYAEATLTAPQTCATCGKTQGTAKPIVSISVTTLPTKLIYQDTSDLLSVEGGKVTLYAEDGTSLEIDLTADMVSGFDSTVAGKQTLTVTYLEKTATYEVEVALPEETTAPAESATPETGEADTTDAGESAADTEDTADTGETTTGDPADTLSTPSVTVTAGCEAAMVSGMSILLIGVAGAALLSRKKQD